MSNISTYLTKIQDLTQKNLDILTLLNDSLYARKKYASTVIDDSQYNVPCFLYIENRLCDLENNWKRLVDAPKTGEAAFVFDGSTKKIQIQGFENAPMPIGDNTVKPGTNGIIPFYQESNDVLKDFITPLVYIKSDLKDIPDHITNVIVKKITTNNTDLYNVLNSTDKTWSSVQAVLDNYVDDVDYCIYDRVYNLPIRYSDYYGKYNIISASKEESLDTITWTLELDNISYTYKDDSMTGTLTDEDSLITIDDQCTLKITSVNGNVIKANVVSGYKNLIPTGSTPIYLKYYKTDEFKSDDKKNEKFIKIPLEEDAYVMIFIAAINKDINVRSTWNTGQLFKVEAMRSESGSTYSEIYKNVRNIGDILNDLTSFSTSTLTNVSSENLLALTNYTPSFGEYKVDILNEHLLDNSSVEYLRKLNVQKAEINSKLSNIQDDIDKINTTLATTDFSNLTTSSRSDYEQRLASLNTQKAQYVKDLSTIINQITITSSSTTLPTSASKYTINGNIPYSKIESVFADTSKAKVIHFELLYRYKNINKDTSRATVLSDTVTVSDWNKYIIDYRQKCANIVNGKMVYEFEGNNTDSTTGRWSTYQIPITQGETVDMMYRVQYDLGYPYISLFSGWSDVVNVEFPSDLITNNDVNSILNTNAEDTENNRIQSALQTEGIVTHVQDKVIDQDLTYFHHPESIASGFYTEDTRRVISLKEKLYEISNELNALKNSAFGSNYKDLSVIVNVENMSTIISANDTPVDITLPTYNELSSTEEGTELKYKTVIASVTVTNTNSTYPINVYSMFPGDKGMVINTSTISKFDVNSFRSANIKVQNKVNTQNIINQLHSQCMYFRNKNKYTGESEYTYSDDITSSNMSIIPYISNISEMQTNSAVAGDYISIGPGEAITFSVQLKVKSGLDSSVTKSMAFDVWNSPFQDALTYAFKFTVPSVSTGVTKVIKSNENREYIAILPTPKIITNKTSNKTKGILDLTAETLKAY